MNYFVCMGRFAKDPVFFPGKVDGPVSVATFTLAVPRPYIDKETGERGADFVDCIAYSRTADIVGKYWKKGMQALIEGTYTNGSYKDKDGVERRKDRIKVKGIYFTERKKDNEPESENDFEEITDDRLPFVL